MPTIINNPVFTSIEIIKPLDRQKLLDFIQSVTFDATTEYEQGYNAALLRIENFIESQS